MENVFFISDEHRDNFDFLQSVFPVALGDPEYQSACYISALPMIFNKFKGEINQYDTPLDWIINWQMKHFEQGEDELDEDYEERTQVDVSYDLTSSMQQLGQLGLNLFNSYDYFNMMDCLNSLDDKNVKVFKAAIDIRLGILKR